MVKLKSTEAFDEDGNVDGEKWLSQVSDQWSPKELRTLRNALQLCQLTGGEKLTAIKKSCLQQGLVMAEILMDLNLDADTIAAAIVYPAVHSSLLSIDDVTDHLGANVASLVKAVLQFENLSFWQVYHEAQIENVRKMLLAMVQDVRSVFLKLADRLVILRFADQLKITERQKLAREVMDIYAPLANRLGLGQLKWELEDLSFRYLEPEIYKNLAKLLHARRVDREHYVKTAINVLTENLQEHQLQNFSISGRAKHIYSIYRKMKRKEVDYDQIYDVSAVRVLVDTVEQCYQVLGIVHSIWQPIYQEFDDYIAQPKANGYRSLHTAVIGPNGNNLEVQIRTYAMHEESELGVAAHWMYKEGAKDLSGYENKIAWLRQVIDWQKEVAKTSGNISEEQQNKVFAERVYVFTPKGDIVDLPEGSTPLDFAYHIHSEVGHRCKGAKVNGNIVQLTYTLKTGERVDVLTGRLSNPSRDWLNPHLGYLKSPRARAKVAHWFKQLDYDRYVAEGSATLDRELRNLGVQSINPDNIAHQLNFKTRQDMLAALGNGDLRLTQITHLIDKPQAAQSAEIEIPHHLPAKSLPHVHSTSVAVEGLDRLLTYTARCCKPVPGDEVRGYITKTKGVAIHRSDCENILRMVNDAQTADELNRLIDVSWGESYRGYFPVDVYVIAHDRQGLVRDITTLLALEKINLLDLNTRVAGNLAHLSLTIEVNDQLHLSRALEKMVNLPNVVSATRSVKT